MVGEENAFALLGDDEAEDVSTFLARVAKKAEASLKSSSHAGSVRGTGGPGRDLWWSSQNDLQQFDKGRADGYQRNNRATNGYRSNNGGTDGYQRYNGGANGYRRNSGSANGYQKNNGTFDGYQRYNGGANGYRRNSGSANGYQKNNGTFDGYQRYNGGANGYRRNSESANGYQNNNGTFDGYQRNYSRGTGTNKDGGGRGRGRGQGRALNGDGGFENESQFVESNQKFENQVQRGGSYDGWENVNKGRSSRDEKQLRNGNLNYGSERRGNGGGGGYGARGGRVFGARDGRNHESGEVMNGSGAKNALGGNASGNIAATTEVSKDAAEDEATKEVRRKAQEEWEKERDAWEARRKAREEEEKEDAKKLTLKQYQQQLLEKRKALEALKPEERKVDVDTDFESMQLVGRKKEDSLLIKQDSEKDKLKKKDDKVRKSVSITEFLKPAEGYNSRGGGGRGGDGYGRGSSFRQAADPANGNARKGKFPKPVEGEKNVDHFERRGGQGGYRRGTSAEPSTGVSQRNGYVKGKRVPAIQDAQQFPDLEAAVKKN
ncbi:RGG repeats nuclear RNA binding protein C-like [Actinidia eriantha]|uniref:RGG repeats nuclear RNA binding protein C-like n=1 Tax=Actinidia eriantha TaxID=165200 RepID=UPI002583A7DE|nr:RGG repeats nuclear RNA binding protein C-like [Actinidia eriantha]